MNAIEYRNLIKQLIDSGSIPPFVYCYPTRSAYGPLPKVWTPRRIWQEDQRHSLSPDLNIYIHVPFCRYKCGFCNLYTIISTSQSLYDMYTLSLCKEIEIYNQVIEKRNLRTIYIGGGTPSLLSARNFETLFTKFDEIYPNWRAVVEEVSIEVSPDSIVDNPSIVKHLLDLGVTRMNLGIQSLKSNELRDAGREAASENVVRQAIHIIKAAGVPDLSTDLIMGFEGQTDESWVQSVEELLALEPDTISTYFLTIRPDAWFSKTGRYSYARCPSLYSRYDLARERILGEGYVQESNVRYKRMGRGGYRQKVLQFRGVPVLGIGAGARSYTNTVDYIVGGGRKSSISQIDAHMKMVSSGSYEISQGFVLNDEERIRKRLVLNLFDLNLSELEHYNVSSSAWVYEGLLEAAVTEGLVARVGQTRYQLTSQGYKYRDILSWLAFSSTVRELDAEFYADLHRWNQHAQVKIGREVEVSGLNTN